MNAALESFEHVTSVPSRRSYAAAFFALIISAYTSWHRFPSIYQKGAMYAEGGTLYFLEAYQKSFLGNIQALDYGYVPLWCRLWAYSISRIGISAAGTAQAYNYTALTVASLCCGAFALPQFRPLVSSDLCRLLVCLGLACAPGFDTKTFINASYYPAIVCYLVLALAAKNQACSTKSGIFNGIFLAISMLSKPHYMAFGPFLATLLVIAIWKRRLGLFTLTLLPLIATCTQFLVLYSHRSRVSPRTLSLIEFVLTWSRWVGSSATAEVFGQVLTSWCFSGIATAFALTIGCIIGLKNRIWKPAIVSWPTILGCSLLFSGIALGILSFPDMYASKDPQYMYSLMEIRHFFIPMVGCYLALAVFFANILPHRGRILLIAMWLSSAFPFGWVKAPAAPTWPAVGFSTWAPLAWEIFDNKPALPPRGCIPVDPYPWILGLDCQMLQDLDSPSALLQRPAFALKARYRSPDASRDWLVDTIGLRLLNIDPKTQQMVAYDAHGAEMARAKAVASPGAALTYFHFKPPLRAPADVAIIDSALQPSSVVMDADKNRPSWVWLGRKIN